MTYIHSKANIYSCKNLTIIFECITMEFFPLSCYLILTRNGTKFSTMLHITLQISPNAYLHILTHKQNEADGRS